jgi:carboxynorspermidine decarboxylase
VAEISSLIAVLSPNLKWVNLGGGYLLDEMNDIDVIVETVKELGEKYDVRVILEPGAALVRTAGYIISTVLDVFQSEGKRVAILDTTVNHMPEVFEYGYSPSAIGHKDEAHEEYVLAGSTCLAGDIFGIYRFPKPITVGSRIIFTEMGAYTLPKAHTFNGVNFPSIYVLTNNRELELLKQFNYTDYASRWSNYVSN